MEMGRKKGNPLLMKQMDYDWPSAWDVRFICTISASHPNWNSNSASRTLWNRIETTCQTKRTKFSRTPSRKLQRAWSFWRL